MQPSLFEEFQKKDELDSGERALIDAARHGDRRAIRDLLAEGASLKAKHPESGRSLAGIAVYYHRHEALEELLAAGADPDASDLKGRSPLMEAVASHCEACMSALLKAGADREAEDPLGYFALLVGAEQERPQHSGLCVKALLEAGADPNHKSKPGYFALASAACAGRVEDVEALIAKGADVNMSDPLGFTALHFAIEFKSAATVAKLLAHGADVTARARLRGESLDALAYAERKGETEIAAMVFAFKELLDLREGFPGLGQFMKPKAARKAL